MAADLSRQQALANALNAAVNEGSYDAAIDALRPLIAAGVDDPTTLSLLSMAMILRSLDVRLRRPESEAESLDPIETLLKSLYAGQKNGHFNKHYKRWRTTRQIKLASLLGLDLAGRAVLVPGDGLGNIGGFLAALGADVTALEGRADNCLIANLQYRKHLGYKYNSRVADLNSDFSTVGRFDMVVALGVLEVVYELDEFIESCAAVSDDVILETAVVDSLDENFRGVDAPSRSDLNDGPLDGRTRCPSPLFIEKKFRDLGFSAERFDDPALNAPMHLYDWKHGDALPPDTAFRRFWRFRRGS